MSMNELWSDIMNVFIECIEDYVGPVSIDNALPSYCNIEDLENFYGNYFYRIKDRMPTFIGHENERCVLITDKLPFVTKHLCKQDTSILLSTYTVVRPRSFALKPFLREEFIRYFQIVISSKRVNKEITLVKIKNALLAFFKRINLHVVLVNRPSKSYYESKSCFYAVWPNGTSVSILQCGVLQHDVSKIFLPSGDDSFILDIGGAQRLLASWIYANSDTKGIIFPEEFRSDDIVFAAKSQNDINDCFIDALAKHKIRVSCDYSLGVRSIGKIKRSAYDKSVYALFIQRCIGDKYFYVVFFRNGESVTINSISELDKFIRLKGESKKNVTITSQIKLLDKCTKREMFYPKPNGNSFDLINEGLFASND